MADYFKSLIKSPSKFLLTNPFAAAALTYFSPSPLAAGTLYPTPIMEGGKRKVQMPNGEIVPFGSPEIPKYLEKLEKDVGKIPVSRERELGLLPPSDIGVKPEASIAGPVGDPPVKKKAPAIVKKKAPKRSLSKNLVTAKNRQKEAANKLLSKDKKTKSEDILSGGEPRTIAKAKKMGKKTFRNKRGKKLAAVTKEELAKSGLSLRDYLNKQRGLTRRKKSGGIVKRNVGGPVRGVGKAMRGFGKAKYSKKMY
jgi:hypothetical protein